MSSALQPRRDYPQPVYPPPVSHSMNPLDHQYQNQYSTPPSSAVFAPNLPALPAPFPSYAQQHQMGNMPGMSNAQMSAPQAPSATRPDLMGVSVVKDGKRYALEVRQQPQRARMCGFGDKDRRPITPPPCVRLVITYADTGKEVDPSEVDPTFFVLSVDLWDGQASGEVNLVRHSSNSPAVSISAATVTPYPPPPERPYIGLLNPGQLHQYYGALGQAPPPPMTYGQQLQQNNYGHMSPPDAGQPQWAMAAAQPVHIMPTHTQGMFTRNLIGSLVVNAAKLEDPDKKVGFWFVLQDLSVRTEGTFRLKMNFIDVADPKGDGTLTTDHAPVLANCYSDSFQVYSAKKFPGVVESTALSKAFASQGVKIPIRKDVPKIPNQQEYDNDEE